MTRRGGGWFPESPILRQTAGPGVCGSPARPRRPGTSGCTDYAVGVMRTRRALVWVGLAVLAMLPALGGCATIRLTEVPRTATEQFLVSTAASRAVSQPTVEPLFDRSVYIDTRYFESIDEPFVLGELRQHLLQGGVRVVSEAEEAEIIVEPRTAGVGVDREDFILGVPSVAVPTAGTPETVASGGTIVTPELAIIKSIKQQGYAGITYVAYWRDTGEYLTQSGPMIGESRREDHWFFGFGPRTSGTIPPAQDE